MWAKADNKKHIYERKMADFMIFDAFDKLLPRLSIFLAKMYTFLVSPKDLPEEDWTFLDKNHT